MVNQDSRQSPQIPKQRSTHKSDCIFFSPRFKSAAAMAGWDEEALRLAFEDTPSKHLRSKKRSDSQSITSPSTNSSRKRKTLKRNSIAAIPAVILDLDEIEGDADSENKKEEPCSNSSVPCIDRLREELSCAICLEICFEPSTTTCGHSFCKKCLQSAAEKCGKRCPKCRHQFSGNGRSCILNTVLWNTIQLLFPQEVEDRKKAIVEHDHEQHQTPPATARRHNRRNRLVEALNSPEEELQSTTWILRRTTSQDENTNLTLILDHDHEQHQIARRHHSNNYRNGGGYNRNRIVEALNSPEDEQQRRRRRTLMRTPSQNEDAAMALRLERQESMEASRQEQQQRRRNPSTYLRAIASRAVSIRNLRRNNNRQS